MTGADGFRTAIEIVTKAIMSREPFVFIGAAGKDMSATLLHGDPKEVASRISSAMEQDDILTNLFEDAVMLYYIKGALESIKPDCSTCKKKDDCPVRSLVEAAGHAKDGCTAIDHLVNEMKKDRRN